MIISEDFDIKLRQALAIHYGLDKIQPYGFDTYRVNIKINDKFEWIYYLDEPYLIALLISFDDLVEGLIDKFEEDKRGVINDN